MRKGGFMMDQNECQFVSLEGVSEGKDKTPPRSPKRNFILFVRRHVTPGQEKKLYRHADALIDKVSTMRGNPSIYDKPSIKVQTEPLKEGDMVRVRRKEEIQESLNHLGRLKGCAFMENEMGPYCGTEQRVLKAMERFVDERELKVKKCKGLILLDGVMCQGTTTFGRCDRSCHLFWREEWLEKID